MDAKLIAAAESLESKADQAKALSIREAEDAVARGDSTKLSLSVMEGIRSTIYREVASSLRDAAALE